MKAKLFYFIILAGLWLIRPPSLLLSQENDHGQIAFVSDRDANREIYLINADGTALTNLTNHLAEDYAPAWAPDGTKLAFVSRRDGTAQIYVMDADGSNVRQLTDIRGQGDDSVSNGGPVWSPDGRRIAFYSQTNFADAMTVYWVNADGGELTEVYSEPGYGGRITWSPDGQQLLFDNNTDGDFNLFVVNLDGSGLQTIATDRHQGGPMAGDPSWEFVPVWSPDGHAIAFNSDRLEGRVDVYVSNPDGSGVRNLTVDVNYAFGPQWSPDSRQLAFMSVGEGLYVADVTSGQLVKASELSFQGVGAEWSWSPDSELLALSAPAAEDRDIYVVAADGSTEVNLTDHPAEDASPVWRPLPPPMPPDGLIAYIGRDGNVWLTSSDSNQQTQVTTNGTADLTDADRVEYCCLQWSHDGRFIAYQRRSANGLWIYDVRSGGSRQLLSESVVGYSWSPDSRSIAYAPLGSPDNPTGIWRIDVETEETTELVEPERGEPLALPQWSSDGHYLAFEEVNAVEGHGITVIYDAQTGNYPNAYQTLGNVDWAPDSNLLVYDRMQYMPEPGGQIWVVDALGVRTFNLTGDSPSHADTMPQFSPSGEQVGFLRVAANQAMGTGGQLWTVNAGAMGGDGSTERQLTTFDAHHFSWAPDSSYLAATTGTHDDREILLVDAQTGGSQFLTAGREPVWQPVPTSATGPVYSVAGEVHDVYGNTLPGITVELSVERSVETDAQGAYEFENVPAGSQAIQIASEPGYRFEPSERDFTLDGDLSGLDFTAIPVTDLGFRPDRNGYRFANRVLDRSWEMFEQYFGRENVTNPDGTPCAAAWEYYENAYVTAGDGYSCVGFSLTSLLSYLGWEQPNAGSFAIESFEALSDQPLSAQLTDPIAYYSGTQRGQQWTDAYAEGLAACASDSGYMIEAIAAGIESGVPPVMVLDSGLGNTWHVVAPYRVEELASDRADVFIYDNEASGRERVIHFERAESGWQWTYTFVGTLAGAGTRSGACSDLFLYSLEAATQPGIPPFNFCATPGDAATSGRILALVPAGVNVGAEDGQGQRLDWEEGSLTSDIPGARAVAQGFGPESPGYGMLLLPLDAYVFYLSAGPDGTTGVTLFGDGRFLSLAGQLKVSGTTVELETNEVLDEVTLTRANSFEDFSMRLDAEGDDGSRLASISAETHEQLGRISISFDGDTLDVSQEANESTSYQISFGTGPEGTPLSGDLHLEGEAAATVQPSLWDDLGEAEIEWQLRGAPDPDGDVVGEGATPDGSEASDPEEAEGERADEGRQSQLPGFLASLKRFPESAWMPITVSMAVGMVILALVRIRLLRRAGQTQAPSEPNRFCVHCGAEYPPTGKFCIKCGKPRE